MVSFVRSVVVMTATALIAGCQIESVIARQGDAAPSDVGTGPVSDAGDASDAGGPPAGDGAVATLGPSDCPTSDIALSADGHACNLPDGTLCGYQFNGSWRECSCGCHASQVWTCFSVISGSTPACPLVAPTPGDACIYDVGCSYLPTASSGGRSYDCRCDATSHTWTCAPDSEGPQECQSGPAPSSDPPGIDPALRIADMTDAQAQAWCTWFVTRGGGLLPPPGEPESTPGIADAYGFTTCGPPLNLCMSVVPVDVCAQNLRLFPCQATVSQLDACALTVANACTLVGAGCTPFEAAANCSQTFVQQTSESVRNCPVRYR